MSLKALQIVSFDNPYPPNFGGVIDVYYKIKALKASGIKVYLHTFYDDRVSFEDLELSCEKIYTYKRDKSLIHLFSMLPFRINSRKSKLLFENISKYNIPVLFEGLHSCSVLLKNTFDVPVFIRTHNIEHQYTFGLAKNEKHLLYKLAHYLEGYKLKYAESILDKAKIIFAISNSDKNYFESKFNAEVIYLPPFHENEIICNDFEIEYANKYALYHGDLSSVDNVNSALFLIKVFENLSFDLVIASSTDSSQVLRKISKIENCSFSKIENNKQLDALINNAHVHTLYSNQKSGTKLKVFNSLYKGKFVIVNKNIVDDTEILNLCRLANSVEEFHYEIKKVFMETYQNSEEKNNVLKKYISLENIKVLINSISY